MGKVNLHKLLSNFDKLDKPYWAHNIFQEIESIILKGYFIRIKLRAAQTFCIFEV